MSDFTVIEIINATTIRVSPNWVLTVEGTERKDDRITIFGLNSAPDNEYVKLRLKSFLLNREVDLINPKILEADEGTIRIACNVLVDKTDITYYFPEFSNYKMSS